MSASFESYIPRYELNLYIGSKRTIPGSARTAIIKPSSAPRPLKRGLRAKA